MASQRRAPRFGGLVPASPAASKTKQRNRAEGGKAELALRKSLWARGIRYRLHAAELPGKPDIVVRRARIAVFVDGDFWHGRNWATRKKKLLSGRNAEYWTTKIEYNMARDRSATAALEASGWTVIRLWEGDILRSPDGASEVVCAALQTNPRQ